MPIRGTHIAARGNWAFMPTQGGSCRERDAYEERVRERDSDEAVVYGEARSSGSGAHSQHVVDGVEVPLDGTGLRKSSLAT